MISQTLQPVFASEADFRAETGFAYFMGVHCFPICNGPELDFVNVKCENQNSKMEMK